MIKQADKSHQVSHHKLLSRIVLISVLVIAVIAGIIIFAVPFPYTAVEVYAESQPQTKNECTQVSIKGNYDNYKINAKCINTEDVCTNTETYCCDSGTECASYEQYCCNYDTQCTSYEQVCCESNWYGGCTKYCTGDCTATEQVCIKTCSRCAGTTSVCKKECTRCSSYSHPCTEYNQYCNVTLKNVDDTSGVFSFTNKFNDNNGNNLKTETKQVSVNAGGTQYISFEYYSSNGNAVNCAGNITGYPTKNQCGDKIVYISVEKERTVVKYATPFMQWTGGVQLRYRTNET